MKIIPKKKGIVYGKPFKIIGYPNRKDNFEVYARFAPEGDAFGQWAGHIRMTKELDYFNYPFKGGELKPGIYNVEVKLVGPYPELGDKNEKTDTIKIKVVPPPATDFKLRISPKEANKLPGIEPGKGFKVAVKVVQGTPSFKVEYQLLRVEKDASGKEMTAIVYPERSEFAVGGIVDKINLTNLIDMTSIRSKYTMPGTYLMNVSVTGSSGYNDQRVKHIEFYVKPPKEPAPAKAEKKVVERLRNVLKLGKRTKTATISTGPIELGEEARINIRQSAPELSIPTVNILPLKRYDFYINETIDLEAVINGLKDLVKPAMYRWFAYNLETNKYKIIWTGYLRPSDRDKIYNQGINLGIFEEPGTYELYLEINDLQAENFVGGLESKNRMTITVHEKKLI